MSATKFVDALLKHRAHGSAVSIFYQTDGKNLNKNLFTQGYQDRFNILVMWAKRFLKHVYLTRDGLWSTAHKDFPLRGVS